MSTESIRNHCESHYEQRVAKNKHDVRRGWNLSLKIAIPPALFLWVALSGAGYPLGGFLFAFVVFSALCLPALMGTLAYIIAPGWRGIVHPND